MISIHALREEGDTTLLRFVNSFFISIHALREEGDKIYHAMGLDKEISIHALREEGDFRVSSTITKERGFLSTPSARRATSRKPGLGDKWFISIHALREEGDRQT